MVKVMKTLFATVVALADANVLKMEGKGHVRGLRAWTEWTLPSWTWVWTVSDTSGAKSSGSPRGGCPSWLTSDMWNQTKAAINATDEKLKLFGDKCDDGMKLYTYEGLCEALSDSHFQHVFKSGDEHNNKLEFAAFVAQTAHESGEFCYVEELACLGDTYLTNPACVYCNTTNSQTGKRYGCAADTSYHGRGPMQLSWNFNYGAFGDFVGKDYISSVAKADMVVDDPKTAWMSAMWYWSTPQGGLDLTQRICHEAAQSGDFAQTTRIINGPVECLGLNTTEPLAPPVNQQNRIDLYELLAKALNVTTMPSLNDCMSNPGQA